MTMFLQGAAAGLAIAMPVGPIAVLIMERGVRRGFRDAFTAGLGAATADLFYAAVAATAGAAAAQLLSPIAGPLRALAAAALLWMAIRSAVRALRACCRAPSDGPARSRTIGTYIGFLGLTILNPLTMVYFASLVIGLDLGSASLAGKAAFVVGAFAASASWQTVLARGGSWLGTRSGPRLRMITALLGSAVVAALAVQTAIAI